MKTEQNYSDHIPTLNERHSQLLLIAGIILLAAALRFYGLDNWSLWIEEHHTIRHSLALDRSPVDILLGRPFFYFGTRQILDLLGLNEFAARIMPALIGIITIPTLYWLTKKVLGNRTAVIATALFAIAPWHLYWSQNARFYTLVLLLYLISLFSFYYWIEKDELKFFFIAVATLAFVSLVHQISSLLGLVYLSYFFVLKLLPFEKPPGLRLRNIALITAVPLAGYIIFEGYNAMSSKPFLAETIYIKFFDEATRTFIGSANPYALLGSTLYYIGIPLSVLSLTGSIFLILERKRIGLLLALGAFFPTVIIMSLTLVATVSNRYLFMTLPCWIILSAVGTDRVLSHIRGRKNLVLMPIFLVIFVLLLRDPVVEDLYFYSFRQPLILLVVILFALAIGLTGYVHARNSGANRYTVFGYLILGLLIVHSLSFNSMYYAFQHGQRDNWKAASSFVQRAKQNGDLMIAAGPGASVGTFYMGEQVISLDSVSIDPAMQQDKRIWLFRDHNLDRDFSDDLDIWTTTCEEEGAWDQYTAGRNWIMRVYRCDPG